jgi:hypothetical protein
MVALAKEKGWKRGIELGLGGGMLFRRLLAEGVSMIGVDLALRAPRRYAQQAIADEFPDICRLIQCSTREAAGLVDDGWADFIFIDAAHGYAAVRDDIARWRSKLAPGGWFGGHDYHELHPGVIRAVDEAFGENVKVLDHWIWTIA